MLAAAQVNSYNLVLSADLIDEQASSHIVVALLQVVGQFYTSFNKRTE